MGVPQPIVASEDESTAATGTREQTLRLLRGVSSEMAALSQDILRLGEALSGEMLAIRQTGRMYDLQSFDLIAQSAQSHAQLLHELIEAMSRTEGCDLSDLEKLIQIIPFHGVRGRLSAALNGRSLQEGDVNAPDDDAEWF